jgi:hypothetical protein
MRFIPVTFALALLSGCASSALYDWGNYEQAAYAYAKDPGEVERYIESLDGIITNAEKTNKVPPGIYAERGYALLSIGQRDAAMQDFARERDKWPESRKLMGLLIDGPPEEGRLNERVLESQPGAPETVSDELAEPSAEAEDSEPAVDVQKEPMTDNVPQ